MGLTRVLTPPEVILANSTQPEEFLTQVTQIKILLAQGNIFSMDVSNVSENWQKIEKNTRPELDPNIILWTPT